MRKPSPNPPAELRNPYWLRGLDRLIERALQIYADADKATPKTKRKPTLARTA